MPLYDYDCAACRRRFEVIHGVHADPPANCPLCGGGPVRKAIAAPTVHFKGSGWAKKERRASLGRSTSSSDDGGSDGDGGKDGDRGKDGDGGKPSTSTTDNADPTSTGAPASTGPRPSTKAPATTAD